MRNKGQFFSKSAAMDSDNEGTEIDDAVESYRNIVILELVRNNDQVGVSKWLQNPNCNVNESDLYGNYAATVAASNNNFVMLELLYEAGAKLDVTDGAELSPLDYAKENENDDMAAFIEEGIAAQKKGFSA